MMAPSTTTPAIFSNAPSSFSGESGDTGFCRSVMVLQVDEKELCGTTDRAASPMAVTIRNESNRPVGLYSIDKSDTSAGRL